MQNVKIGDKVFRLYESSCSNVDGKGLPCRLRKGSDNSCPYRNDKACCEFHQSMFVKSCLVTEENVARINDDLGVYSFATRSDLVEEIKNKNIKVVGWVEK